MNRILENIRDIRDLIRAGFSANAEFIIWHANRLIYVKRK